jgi:hypothetical protein
MQHAVPFGVVVAAGEHTRAHLLHRIRHQPGGDEACAGTVLENATPGHRRRRPPAACAR